MKLLRAPAAALLLCLGACSAERITTPGAPEASFDVDAWSGGTLVIRSTAFRGADTWPDVTIGTDTLGVRPYGSDAILVQIPDTDGWVDLQVRFRRGGGGPIGAVRVHGFLEPVPAPEQAGGLPLSTGDGTVLAYINGRVSRLVVSTGAVTTVLPDSGRDWEACVAGPMPSLLPGLAVVSHLSGSQCGPLVATPVAPGAAAPDTGPAPQAYSLGPILHIARGRWLVRLKDGLQFITGSPATGFVARTVSDGEGNWWDRFVVSPRGDRVVETGTYHLASPQSVPVLDPGTMDIAFAIADAYRIDGAAFSDGGDTLYAVVISTPTSAPVLTALDAATGRVLSRTECWGGAVALDPERPFIYLAARGLVEVRERPGLGLVARVRAPRSRPTLGYFGDGPATAVFGAGPSLYVLASCSECLSWPRFARLALIP